MSGPLRRLLAALLPALLIAGLITGCGDDGDKKPVTDLLDQAFANSIGSADMKLDIEAKLDGVEQLKDPIEVSFQGPYKTGGKTKIPSVDWDITVRAQNQSFNASLISTGDRAFVGFQGTDYEVSQETVARLNQQIAESAKKNNKQSLGDFGVSPREWVVDSSEEGDEDVAGVETTHVSGKLDVAKVLDDLNKVVERASKLGGQVGQQAPPKLTDEQKEQVERVVKDPKFDAYIGKDDKKLHRLSADIDFEVPKGARGRVGGLEGGTVSFSIEFSNIGNAKPVSVPKAPRPIGELVSQLRGLFGGALGGGAAAPQQQPDTGGAGGSAGQSTPEKQKAYDDCVKTDPSDESVKAFCQVLLQ